MPRALSSRQTTANSSSAGSSKRKQLDNGGETPGRQKRLKLIDQTSTTPKNGARRNGLAQTSPTKAQHGRTKSNHSDRTVVDENGQHEDRTTSNVVRFNSLTPTQREWKEMAVYRSFTMPDPDNYSNTFEFRVGDIINVLPLSGDRTGESWVARIQSVKARSSSQIWCRVTWFYSRYQFADIRQASNGIALDPSYLGKKELIETDHEDYINALSCEGHVQVKDFVEQAVDQCTLSENEYYRRISYSFQTSTIEGLNLSCKPSNRLCKKPYNPDVDIQRYCPDCAIWFHEHCIEEAKWSLSTSAIRTQATSVIEALRVCLPSPRALSQSPAKPKMRNSRPPSKVGSTSLLVPPKLEKLAAQSIRRGAHLGISGNIKAVFAARSLIVDAESGILKSFDNWEAHIEPNNMEAPKQPIEPDASPSITYYRCAHCGNII